MLKTLFKRKKKPYRYNVVILSMRRCGISWIFDAIKKIHVQLHGKTLDFQYENDRELISNNLIPGIHQIYDVDPQVLLNLGYDKIIAIKRELEIMKIEHAKYYGYLETHDSYEVMQEQRPAFFEKIRLYYELLYEQEIHDERYKVFSLEDFNNYTYSTFEELYDFLEFKFSFIQKIKFIIRVFKNHVRPFMLPIVPKDRNWSLYSAMLPRGHVLCNRLEYMKQLEQHELKNKIHEQLENEVIS